ncbi:MAG: MFS transporter [Candidatus Thermoplasmatota archaeon]|nr:MFS transporter [Candidatus Thermoplasmatota archaeon]MCL5794545.1 MFS transporter [Candidatus Thermoplasmatota archaeon]
MSQKVVPITESVSDNYTKKNFSLLMVETGISTFTTSLFTVLILWISISETKSALITGVTSAMLVAPLILSIVVGAFIDRAHNKKVFAILGPVLKALATGILLIVIRNNSLISDSIFLFISALAFGFSIDLLVPIRAIWSQMFLRKPIYLKGMSVANLVSRTSRLAGFLVASVLFTINLRTGILIILILYLISILPILFIDSPKDTAIGKGTLREVMKDGIQYLSKTRVVAEIVFISAFSALFWGMSDSASSVMINRVFDLSSSYLSYTFFAISLGGITGSTLTSKLKSVKNVGKKLPLLYGLGSLSVLLIAIFTTVYVLLSVFFVIGFLSGITSPLISAVLFGNVPREKMGRIQGAMDTFGTSFNSVSGILAGVIMTIMFPGDVFYIMAVGLATLSVIVSRFKVLSKLNV